MFCPRCGNSMGDTDRFCQRCGQARVEIRPAQSAPVAPPTYQPVPAAPQSIPSEAGKKPPKSRKKMAILISSIAAVLVLALVAGLMLPMLFGGETVYVRTQVSYYDTRGICYKRIDYTYDEQAQLLSETYYEVEGYYVFDPIYDINIWTYDADSPLVHNEYQFAQYDYDEQGNCTLIQQFNGNMTGTYAWEYDGDRVKSYVWTHPHTTNVNAEYFFSYDDGNITSIYHAYDTTDNKAIRLEYDSDGRLIWELTWSKAGEILEKNYRYEDDLLVEVELRTGYGNYVAYDGRWEECLSTCYTYHLVYDNHDQLTRMTVLDEKGKQCETREYSYDHNGYPEAMERTTTQDIDERTTYTCDENGNILEIRYEDGSCVQYRYEAVEVTHQQAAYYRRRLGMLGYEDARVRLDSILMGVRYGDAYYYLIPNPLFDFPYLDLIA